MHYVLLLLLCLLACQSNSNSSESQDDPPEEQSMSKTLGSIERLDDRINALIPNGAVIEVLGEGHDWSEGPVWIESEQMLLYSDIPPNAIYKWTEEGGTALYLQPSGYTGHIEREGEPGSNGLLLNAKGELVLCQHGDRRIAKYVGDFSNPQPQYETIVETYEGKRFNSPNDATYSKNGTLYFTDPPYGLEGNVDDPAKEIRFQGVYRLDPQGNLTLLTDQMSRPNGIALSPDEQTLYVANSDPDHAVWMAFPLQADGTLGEGRVIYDATSLVGKEKGLPDGLKVHPSGNLFATGPGGVWIITPEGEVLGKIKTGEATANCAFDNGFENLFITADMYLLRVKLK